MVRPRQPREARSRTAQTRVRQVVSPGSLPMTLVRRRVSPKVRSMKTPRRTGATKMTAPGYLARPSDRAPAADGLPVAVDPSTASFRALALQVRAMGLLDRRPGYYRLKITLTIFAFLPGWMGPVRYRRQLVDDPRRR